jgi:hypothetical protein
VKVIIDTRHDTFEQALAAVRSAYGVPIDPEGSADGVPMRTTNGSRRHRRNTAAMNPTSNISPKGESEKIRAWARSQGLEVKDSGRMPAAVIRAYEAAQSEADRAS